jgi:hypothetical protein
MAAWRGNVVGVLNNPTTARSSGIWSLAQQYLAVRAGVWPVPSGIIRSGLVLNLDAGNTLSAPGTGNTWFDLSPTGLNATGSSAITGGFLNDTQPYTTASTSILNTDTHTISIMLQINNTNGNWSKIFGYEPAGSDRSPGIWRWPTSRRLHWRYDPTNTSADFSVDSTVDDGGTQFVANRWYYLTVVKNGSTAVMYRDATRLGQKTVANPKTTGNSPIYLYPSYNQNTSRMAMVHIYNRALSDAEVLENFNIVRSPYGI